MALEPGIHFPSPAASVACPRFLHLTSPLPGQPAPTPRLQVVVSPAGMPGGGASGQQSAHSLPGCAGHSRVPPPAAGEERWVLRRHVGGCVRRASPWGGCQPASSTPRASQVCEGASVCRRAGGTIPASFPALLQDGCSGPGRSGTLPRMPVTNPQPPHAHQPHRHQPRNGKVSNFTPCSFLPFGTRDAWGGALRDTHTVGS